jgi:hypothetical protein
MKARPFTWFVLVLCVITGVLIVSTAPDAEQTTRRCKPIDRKSLVLWLSEEWREAESDFIAKAERLNASGLCVIDGGYGKSYQKFYYSIDKDGKPNNYYHLRFTRDELRR